MLPELGVHELVDRTSIIGETFDTFIQQHHLVPHLPEETKDRIERIARELGKLYVELGNLPTTQDTIRSADPDPFA